MSNSRNDRNNRFINGPGHDLLVKGPQILHTAAASSNDQQITQLVIIGVADGCGDLSWCLCPLYPNGKQQYLHKRIPLAQDPQHIVDSCTGAAGNDADGTGKLGNWFFVGRIKKPLGFQLLF